MCVGMSGGRGRANGGGDAEAGVWDENRIVTDDVLLARISRQGFEVRAVPCCAVLADGLGVRGRVGCARACA